MRIFIFILFFSISFTQVFSTYDYVGSKATAMSGSITSGPGGTWSIFHNPAQLSDLDGFNMTSGHCKLYGLNFLSYSNFGLSYNSWAINFEKLSTTINDISLSSESVFGISKGIDIYKDRQSIIQAGVRLNFYRYHLGDSAGTEGDGSLGEDLGSGGAKGLDLGFQGVLNNKYYIAYHLQNINSFIQSSSLGSDLPQSFSIGLSYRPYEDLLTSLDFNQLSGYSESEIRFGIEYLVMDLLIIRAGVQNNSNRFSGGFEYSGFSYSFITHHVLPITHQFSLSISF